MFKFNQEIFKMLIRGAQGIQNAKESSPCRIRSNGNTYSRVFDSQISSLCKPKEACALHHIGGIPYETAPGDQQRYLYKTRYLC